jgi:hypothetical protein
MPQPQERARLDHATGNDSITLWGCQVDRRENAGKVKRSPAIGNDSDEIVLSSFTNVTTLPFRGRVSGPHLSGLSAYSNDPKVAVGEWAQKLMTYVNGHQGSGHTFVDNVAGTSEQGIIGTVGWQRSTGSPHRLKWDLNFYVGRGEMQADTSTPNTVNLSNQATCDGYDLGELRSLREEKQQAIKPYPLATGDVDLRDKTGAQRAISISGRKEGDFTTFRSHFESLMGTDTFVTYDSAFPGHTLDVYVEDFSRTYEAGKPNTTSYTMVLVEGSSVQ